jgi:hypothetical protein
VYDGGVSLLLFLGMCQQLHHGPFRRNVTENSTGFFVPDVQRGRQRIIFIQNGTEIVLERLCDENRVHSCGRIRAVKIGQEQQVRFDIALIRK